MAQPASYLSLKPSQRVFVLEYLRSGCDPVVTMRNLHQDDDDITNKARASRMMSNPDVMAAITDKLEDRLGKYSTTREAMTERLFALIDDVANLPESKQRVSHLKFILDVYAQINKISGLQHIRHTHEHQRSISINLVGVDAQGVPIQDIKSIDVPTDPATGADPLQLPLAFPSSDAVRYTIGELLDPSNDLSIDQDSANDSTQSDIDTP